MCHLCVFQCVEVALDAASRSTCLTAKQSRDCLAAIFDLQLPPPKLSLTMPLSHKRGFIFLFQNNPCGEGNCVGRLLSRQFFASRHSDVSPGPLGGLCKRGVFLVCLDLGWGFGPLPKGGNMDLLHGFPFLGLWLRAQPQLQNGETFNLTQTESKGHKRSKIPWDIERERDIGRGIYVKLPELNLRLCNKFVTISRTLRVITCNLAQTWHPNC